MYKQSAGGAAAGRMACRLSAPPLATTVASRLAVHGVDGIPGRQTQTVSVGAGDVDDVAAVGSEDDVQPTTASSSAAASSTDRWRMPSADCRFEIAPRTPAA
jgi:hypothetical protein